MPSESHPEENGYGSGAGTSPAYTGDDTPVESARETASGELTPAAARGSALWHLRAVAPGTGLLPVHSADEDALQENIYPRWESSPEEFFHLYAGIERSAGERRVIGVTSAVAGEGKTTVALHLALSAARSTYLRICLIDLSMGEDDLCRRIGVAPAPGGAIPFLESGQDEPSHVPGLIEAGTSAQIAVLECRGESARLDFIPAASAPHKAERAARSPRVSALIDTLRDEYDLVVVDLPPIVTDNALPLIRKMDGILMVARAGATPRGVMQSALALIGRDCVIGMVMNRVKSPHADHAKDTKRS